MQEKKYRQPIKFSDDIYKYPILQNWRFPGEIFLRVSDYFPNTDFNPKLFVSNYGRIYDAEKIKYNSNNIYLLDGDTNRYKSIVYGTSTKPIHRVMLSCFVEDHLFDEHLQPDHINGIKNDNRINLFNSEKNNLEWVTRSENITRAYNLGLSKTGEENVHSNITKETAMKVIELLATGKYTSKQIVDILDDPNLSIHIIDDIRKKETWARKSEGYEFHQRINRQFTEDDVHHFCQSFQRQAEEGSTLCINDKCRVALKEYGFEPSERFVETLRKIYVKKYYPHIVSQYNF